MNPSFVVLRPSSLDPDYTIFDRYTRTDVDREGNLVSIDEGICSHCFEASYAFQRCPFTFILDRVKTTNFPQNFVTWSLFDFQLFACSEDNPKEFDQFNNDNRAMATAVAEGKGNDGILGFRFSLRPLYGGLLVGIDIRSPRLEDFHCSAERFCLKPLEDWAVGYAGKGAQ